MICAKLQLRRLDADIVRRHAVDAEAHAGRERRRVGAGLHLAVGAVDLVVLGARRIEQRERRGRVEIVGREVGDLAGHLLLLAGDVHRRAERHAVDRHRGDPPVADVAHRDARIAVVAEPDARARHRHAAGDGRRRDRGRRDGGEMLEHEAVHVGRRARDRAGAAGRPARRISRSRSAAPCRRSASRPAPAWFRQRPRRSPRSARPRTARPPAGSRPSR